MKKFFIKTLGCKSNQLENEIIINELVKRGYEQTADFEEADFYILNSCAVTEKAATESLYYLKNIKHKKPQIKTILTGCVAQLKDFDKENDVKRQISVTIQYDRAEMELPRTAQ